jgi:uncharacterized protein (TIGR03083 family)
MGKVDVWPTVHAERKALAADLGAIRADEWSTESLCSKWSVRDVLAHMTGTARITPPAFLGKMIGSGFSLGRLQTKDIARERGGSAADTLSNFESVITSSKHPPGPNDTWLGEVIIHSEDIRRPLGIKHEYPIDAVVQVAEFYKGSNLIVGAKKRIGGLTLKATDAEWSTGAGPEVSGPALSLVLAMTGRRSAVDDLSGDGVETLRSRT